MLSTHQAPRQLSSESEEHSQLHSKTHRSGMQTNRLAKRQQTLVLWASDKPAHAAELPSPWRFWRDILHLDLKPGKNML